ncbi:MAG: VWA domain-containing protein [Bacteroidetes bacterium]|jgi:uncharacterized protein YegL|nr:VWA domain-containing protein [Bacteroidota bacterium]
MAANDFYKGKLPENYEQKCPVVFVLDVSGSMSGDPIIELNKGLAQFQEEIQDDTTARERLDIAVVSFGSDVQVEHDFKLIAEYNMPQLTTRGSTNLVDGMRKGMELIRERKNWYQQTHQTYYRPYLIMITDGYPNECPKKAGLNDEIEAAARNKEFNFWAIGVQGANMEMLKEMAVPQFNGSLKPLQLRGIRFVELFKWLSASFSKISNSKEGDKINIRPEKTDDDDDFMITAS